MITCLTLSDTAWEHKGLSRSIRYLNLVGKHVSHSALNETYLNAFAKINTEVFFVQDTEDPLPNFYVDELNDKGFVRGPIKVDVLLDNGGVVSKTFKRSQMQAVRAFFDTEKVKTIAQYLPMGEFDTFVLLFYFLEEGYGYDINNELVMTYRKTPLGRDRLANAAITNSTHWIASNGRRILTYL